MCEPRHLTTQWAYTACYSDTFTFTFTFTMFGILDSANVFMICVRTKYHMLSFRFVLLIAPKPKAKEIFCMAAALILRSTEKAEIIT
jgi:hypothetical protein